MEFKIIDKPALNYILCFGFDEEQVHKMINDFIVNNSIKDTTIFTSEFRITQGEKAQVAYMRYATVPDNIKENVGFRLIKVEASKYLSCKLDNMSELYGKNTEAEEFLRKNGLEMDMSKLAPMIETNNEGKFLLVKLK
ncbi:MAG: hypothetical protein ACOX4W_05180 [Bacilli bacterium]